MSWSARGKVRRKEAKPLRDNITSLSDKLASADAEKEKLEAELAWLKNQLYGAKSERRILEALSPAGQLWLGEQMLKP